MGISQQQDYFSDEQDLTGANQTRYSTNVIVRRSGYDWGVGNRLQAHVKRDAATTGTASATAVIEVDLISSDTDPGSGNITSPDKGVQRIADLAAGPNAAAFGKALDAKVDPKKITGRYIQVRYKTPAGFAATKVSAWMGPPTDNRQYVPSRSKT